MFSFRDTRNVKISINKLCVHVLKFNRSASHIEVLLMSTLDLHFCGELHKFMSLNESRHEKNHLFAYAKTKTEISCALIVQLISTFVFATWIVQSLFYLNPKFQTF